MITGVTPPKLTIWLRAFVFFLGVCFGVEGRTSHWSVNDNFECGSGAFARPCVFGWTDQRIVPHSADANRYGWQGSLLGTFSNESVGLEILDPFPAGPGDANLNGRFARLSFDLILRGYWTPLNVFDITTVRSDGITQNRLHTSFDTFSIGTVTYPYVVTEVYRIPGVEGGYHVAMDFPLGPWYEPEQGASFSIIFNRQSSIHLGTWGIDNLTFDWGQPIPLPASAILLASGLVAFGLGRCRRRTSRDD